MIVYLLLTITLLIAALSTWYIHKGFRTQGKGKWLQMLTGLTLGSFIYLYGTWFYLSIYVQYLFALVVLCAMIAGHFAKNKIENKSSAPRNILKGIVATICTTLVILYFTGISGKPETIDLQFPFKKGDYFVMQGGKGLPTNFFHFNSRRAVYAIDIAKLDDKGRRAKHVFSKDLNDYFTFGDTVYAPCAGTIVRATDDNPDNIPPERKRGPHNLNGVLIEAENCFVFMGHFKLRSVFVKEGDYVKTSTPIGLAGNSGFSLEPHLHIQVHKKVDDGKMWYEQPQLFIRFNGKEYLLFQKIKAG